ncbi:MAG: hypothetical protein K2V38_00120, partial [Gemmataceae bacterium]|nr:hypothetical protein [Gemmataceae bacterium]
GAPRDLTRPPQPVRSVGFGPDGRSLVAAFGMSSDLRVPVVEVWELPDGGHRKTVEPGQATVGPFLAIGARSPTCAVAHTEGVSLYQSPGFEPPVVEVKPGQGEPTAVDLRADGRAVAFAVPGAVWLCDAATGRALAPEVERDEVLALAFAPDGQSLFAGGKAGVVWEWPAADPGP